MKGAATMFASLVLVGCGRAQPNEPTVEARPGPAKPAAPTEPSVGARPGSTEATSLGTVPSAPAPGAVSAASGTVESTVVSKIERALPTSLGAGVRRLFTEGEVFAYGVEYRGGQDSENEDDFESLSWTARCRVTTVATRGDGAWEATMRCECAGPSTKVCDTARGQWWWKEWASETVWVLSPRDHELTHNFGGEVLVEEYGADGKLQGKRTEEWLVALDVEDGGCKEHEEDIWHIFRACLDPALGVTEYHIEDKGSDLTMTLGGAPARKQTPLEAAHKLAGEGKWGDAVTELRKAREADMTNSKVAGELGWALFNAGELAEAKKVTSEALGMASKAASKGALLYNLGRIAEAEKDTRAAIDFYQRSLAERPENKAVKKRLEQLSPK